MADAADLAGRQARSDRLLAAEGAGHLVHDLPVRADGRSAALESRPWRLDPIPVVIDAPTFARLSAAVAERVAALEAVLDDLYGDRLLVRERIVPPEALAASPRYRPGAIGSHPDRWITTYAVDLVVAPDGTWSVAQDLTDAPPGLGYALLDRSVMTRVWPDVVPRAGFAPLADVPAVLRRALASASQAESPRTVLFSGGLDHPSYVDHSFLAVQLGINLVEGADLVVRRRRLWLRTLDRLEPVDVVYRRLEDVALDPLEVGSTGSVGVPGLAQAVRSGGVVVANAVGSGILEEPTVRAVLHEAIERVAPGRHGFAPHVPGGVIGEVPVAAGALGPSADRSTAPVVVRLFAVHDGDRVVVVPGGTGRVLAPGDDPGRPTACLAKDVWVLGRSSLPTVGGRLPQVDFGRSVPTRAADALHWVNRSAERAEAMTRTARIVMSRLEQDPAAADDPAWVGRMVRLLDAVDRRPPAGIDATVPSLREVLSRVCGSVADEVGALLTEATTVREYLSVTTGRVLAHLAELRAALRDRRAGVDELDAVLADFAAVAGLWQESTVRGPAWRLGDTGRRLERCLVVLDLVSAARPDPDGGPIDDGQLDAVVTEVLLAANDSLVAYRRRHRSDVEWPAAVDLLVRDVSNPRSFAACVERLSTVAAGDDATVDPALVDRIREAIALPVDDLLVTARPLVEQAGRDLVARWFSTPVNPIVMVQGDER